MWCAPEHGTAPGGTTTNGTRDTGWTRSRSARRGRSDRHARGVVHERLPQRRARNRWIDDNGQDGDYHLLPGSPAIDSGFPGSDYCSEPEPNGCRVNMGAYGNTSEATNPEGSEHCVCE